MELENHYAALWENSLQEFRLGRFEIDPYLTSAHDDRYGITQLFRPEDAVKKNIAAFLQELKQLEPNQYYYPSSDIHTTVLSIISCHTGFRLESIEVGEYVAVLQECMTDVAPFRIDYRGVTASPACIMVQGFPETGQLNALRDRLRQRLKSSPLRHSIDSRYVLQTAHSTVVRFREPLRNAAAFLEKLQEFRAHAFGSTRVQQVELVYNDWYQRQEEVRKLGVFRFK
ncbi:mutarotase [Pontibacter sp. E15-1]|uniref:2'-5' RNA ligase family protein n=1 Tax=Pontibacter sp. E15-1 TaxID=2919918 RepID=UPI001F4F5267|nr:mutarotase [Pontibacter sp. E15-1]MCJ8163483.1 mutarotase [Pontibacter sp. E15-1]